MLTRHAGTHCHAASGMPLRPRSVAWKVALGLAVVIVPLACAEITEVEVGRRGDVVIGTGDHSQVLHADGGAAVASVSSSGTVEFSAPATVTTPHQIMRRSGPGNIGEVLQEQIAVDDGPGPPGPPGPPGAIIGPHGFPGPPGRTGPKGDRGRIGEPGVNGSSVLGKRGDRGKRGPPGKKGIMGEEGDKGTYGPVGSGGVAPHKIDEWEQSLDSYSNIVGALDKHTKALHSLMDEKAEMMETKMGLIRMRLRTLAQQTGTLRLMTKDQLTKLALLLKSSGLEAEHATLLRRINSGDVREAEKLTAVAQDTMTQHKKCKTCQEESGWFSSKNSVSTLSLSLGSIFYSLVSMLAF